MKPQTLSEPWGLDPVSISVNAMNPEAFLQTVAYEAGVSVVVPPLDSEQPITAELNEQPAQTVFESVAEQLGLVAQFRDGVVTLVKPDQALQDFYIVRTGYMDQERAQNALRSVLGQGASVERMDDRLVVTGSPRILEQARNFSEHWGTGPDAWLLDVRVVRITQSMSRELGIEWNATVRAGIDTTSMSNTADADLIVQAIGRAIETGTDAALLQKATLYLIEGQEARLNQGQRVPVPRYSTSPEGTTTTTGYDYIDAGFTLDALAHRTPEGIRLDLTPSISSVTAFVGDAPITTESTVRVSALLRSSEWIIISGLETARESNDRTGLPGLPPPIFGKDDSSSENAKLLVLVQAQRIRASS